MSEIMVMQEAEPVRPDIEKPEIAGLLKLRHFCDLTIPDVANTVGVSVRTANTIGGPTFALGSP